MPFLLLNQQHQSTEGSWIKWIKMIKVLWSIFAVLMHDYSIAANGMVSWKGKECNTEEHPYADVNLYTECIHFTSLVDNIFWHQFVGKTTDWFSQCSCLWLAYLFEQDFWHGFNDSVMYCFMILPLLRHISLADVCHYSNIITRVREFESSFQPAASNNVL